MTWFPCFLFVSGVILATMIVAWQPIWGLIYMSLVDNDLNASWGNVSPRIWEFLLDFPCIYFKYQLLRVSSQRVTAMYLDSKHNPVHNFSFHPLSQGKIVDFYWSNFSLVKHIDYWLWRDDFWVKSISSSVWGLVLSSQHPQLSISHL